LFRSAVVALLPHQYSSPISRQEKNTTNSKKDFHFFPILSPQIPRRA